MESIPHFFERNTTQYKNNPFLWENSGEKYKTTTYGEFRTQVRGCAAGLKLEGITSNDQVALLSEGRNYWIMSEISVLYNGAICVPLSTKLNEAELVFRLNHAECSTIFVSAQQYPKIKNILGELTTLKRIIHLDKSDNPNDLHIDTLINNGLTYLKEHTKAFDQMWQSVKPTDFANICYTSGTTADPKGIVLTHDNYTANARQGNALMNIPSHFVMLIVLPWDHAFAHTAGVYSLMMKGASLASVQLGKTALETLRNIPKNISEVRPHFMLSVPSLAKNFKKNIESGIIKKGPKVEKLFHKAMEVAYRYNKEGNNKGGSLWDYLQYKFYDQILFKKIRKNFGGRLKMFIGGGALLDIDLQKFFYAIGIPMFQGYGLSESSPIISSNAPQKHKLGSSGQLVPEMDLAICDEKGNSLPIGEKGEIVIKGPNVMHSYWKNETATKETIKEDWLYTGDMGHIDSEGYLYVMGRFKSLLISNDGEKYSPEGIEETIIEHSTYIDQMILHNNQDPYTVALVHLNKERIKRYAQEQDIEIHTTNGMIHVLKMIQHLFDDYRQGGKHEGLFPDRWLPSAIAILPEGFTEENLMMNSTMKIVRNKIESHYNERLSNLYTAQGKNITNEENLMTMHHIFGGK